MKKYYFLIIVALIFALVLTGCSLLSNIGQAPATEQSGITYLTKSPGNDLFIDDFESYAPGTHPSGIGLGDWSYVSGAPGIVSDTIDGVTSQALSIVGGSYVGEVAAVAGSSTWQDYSLDLDAKKDSGDYFWIAFRYVNSGTYYIVAPSSDTIHIALMKRVGGGGFTDLDLRPEQATVAGTWYHYRIELRTTSAGTNIKVFVDGVNKFDVTDNTAALATGRVGVGGGYFWAPGSEGRFDNLVVQYLYGFEGLLPPYAPPDEKAFKLGSTIPLKWQYTDSDGNVVDSADANPTVGFVYMGAGGGTGTLEEEDAPGASGLRYDDLTMTWQFNWQTKGRLVGTYEITITSGQAESSDIFPIALRK